MAIGDDRFRGETIQPDESVEAQRNLLATAATDPQDLLPVENDPVAPQKDPGEDTEYAQERPTIVDPDCSTVDLLENSLPNL